MGLEEPAVASAAALTVGSKGQEKAGLEEPAVVSAAALTVGSKGQEKAGLEEPAVVSAAAFTVDSKGQEEAAVVQDSKKLWRVCDGIGLRQVKPPFISWAGDQGWALLDPLVLEETNTEYSTAFALCKSSDDKHVRVSICLHEPPYTSYIQMHTDADVHDKPRVVAADGNFLLIHMVVAVSDPPPVSYYDNFFVYKADPSMGFLQCLPQSAEWGAQARHFGIASSAEKFVVAAFKTSIVGAGKWGEGGSGNCKEVGKLIRFTSFTCEWETVELPIPYNPTKGLYEFVWDSDDLFPFDKFMFWVDYHRGMLYCDVFSELPFLRFIQLPGINVWDEDHDYSNGRQLPRAYRSVGVSSGHVRFVDIDNGLFGTKKTSGFTVTIWTLTMSKRKWAKSAVLEIDDLWSLSDFRDSPLPRWVPEFPVMSNRDDRLIHCILRGPQSAAKAWIVTLDMKEKVMRSYSPFINKYKLASEDCSLDTRHMFLDTPLICCDLDPMYKPSGFSLFVAWSKGKESFTEEDSNQRASSFCVSFSISPLEDMDDVTIKLRCPACDSRSGLLKWYDGIPGLIDHARSENLEMVDAHRKFAKLLGEMQFNATKSITDLIREWGTRRQGNVENKEAGKDCVENKEAGKYCLSVAVEFSDKSHLPTITPDPQGMVKSMTVDSAIAFLALRNLFSAGEPRD